MKAAVCVIVKNENLYLDEWVSHYLDINKFDHIFIYDHNDPEGEHIKDYGENVTVIDFRGHEKPCQHVAYEDCYKTYGEEYDWILFVDADEFLYIPETDNDIHTFLEAEKFKHADIICLNWVHIHDGNRILFENIPMKERFKDCELWDCENNKHRKEIVRTGLGKIDYDCPHVPFIRENEQSVLYVTPDGKKTSAVYADLNFEKYNKIIYLKHYNTKTIEEFLIKLSRGYPDQQGIPWKTLDKAFNYFFSLNEKTPEKLEYIRSFGINYNYED